MTTFEAMGLFADAFVVADVGAAEVAAALGTSEPDFEDGLVRAVAKLWECSHIISRDESAFRESRVPRVTVHACLEGLG